MELLLCLEMLLSKRGLSPDILRLQASAIVIILYFLLQHSYISILVHFFISCNPLVVVMETHMFSLVCEWNIYIYGCMFVCVCLYVPA
jgi:hypothetical protein